MVVPLKAQSAPCAVQELLNLQRLCGGGLVQLKKFIPLLAGVIFSMLPGADQVLEAYCGTSGLLTAKDGLCPDRLHPPRAACSDCSLLGARAMHSMACAA